MRTVEQTVYTFDELSEQAKETARDWFRSCLEPSDHAETVLEDAARLGSLIGIDIRTRPVKLMGGGTRNEPNVYWSLGRNAGVSFAGSYSYRRHSVKELAKEAPSMYDGKEQPSNAKINEIAWTLAEVQKRNFYQVQANIGHARHLTLDIDVERADGRDISDSDIETVTEALEDFAHWIERQLQDEYEYQYSEECVDDAIRANEYEFDVEGNRA